MFRTVFPQQTTNLNITHQNKILLLGSCFTQNIGVKLKDLKFETLNNPFGILYNPVSIFESLNIICLQKEYRPSDLVFNNEQYHSFEHHSDFSNSNKTACLNSINKNIKSGLAFLSQTNYCFISLGSAFVHKHIEANKTVANCHKFPNTQFEKKLLSVQQIVNSFELTIHNLKNINPKLQFIFTVSPIRHLKDGFHNNQLSKATLLLAITELQKKYDQVHYFPSYELLMDDLRDYRFYEDDMLHPSKKAIEYIWNYFSETYFNENTKKLNQKIQKLNSSLKHKPFNSNSEAHIKFQKKTNLEIQELQKKHPYIRL